jgi:hypothetical protein
MYATHLCKVKVASHTSSYLMSGSQARVEGAGKLSEATLSSEGAMEMLSKKGMMRRPQEKVV